MQLDTPVQFVRGVGPARAEHLRNLGISTVADLVQHFPFRYEHRPPSQAIGSLRLNETATIVGRIRRVRTRGSAQGEMVVADVEDGTGTCVLRWFHSTYLRDKLGPGLLIAATGVVAQYRNLGCLINPKYQLLDESTVGAALQAEQFDPVYPATAALASGVIAKLIAATLPQVIDQIAEPLPDPLRAARGFPPRRTAVERFHRPTRREDGDVARRRLAYDELLLLQLAVQLRRAAASDHAHAPTLPSTPEIDRRIRARFGFSLTAGQNAAIAEIVADLAQVRPMRRLLQADVGAGKTAVALYAALVAVANRRQVAFLAPTEILAEQHYHKIARTLVDSRVRLGLLVGDLPAPQREDTRRSLAAGQLDLVVGTHALLEEDVAFARLGLVIVDEQHRFGVRQRARLRAKGRDPHYLVLTATPIPRTLAMSVFGDLDVSTIRELPPGRQPVETRVIGPREMAQAWEQVRQELRAGRQAYLVYPLVERTDGLPLKAAAEELEQVRQGPLAGFRVELLHGQMRGDAKEAVMARFAAGEIDALAATTVVEVGLDVPNATVMVIHHAERFGLSQLHQLRGRIARGRQPGHCLLCTEADPAEGLERLAILCRTRDGFEIAEEDLRLRGPGEVVGRRQHGLPEFMVADLARDLELLEWSRQDAAALVTADPTLTAPAHRVLRRMLLNRFGDALAWVDVA